MSRLSRSQLKGLVKECLLEILSEGIGGSESQMISESASPRRQQRPSRERSSRKSALDHVSFGAQSAPNPKFNETVENIGKSLTQDPVMQAIFSDTAKTTLQEQLNAGGPASPQGSVLSQGDDAARHMASSDPSDLFSGASQNWAALAFGDESSQK